jgi:hypothetical protein
MLKKGLGQLQLLSKHITLRLGSDTERWVKWGETRLNMCTWWGGKKIHLFCMKY